MSTFAPEELLAEAEAATGLDDFGDDRFRDGLAVYCRSLAHEAQLNELGNVAIRGNIVGALANRLRVVDWSARHREVAEERVDAPVFVIGMFRAGTTLLSYLLDQDRANRPLLLWEAGDSVPPATPETFRQGPRVDAVRERAAVMDQINPLFKTMHHEEADGPTECIAMMGQDFKSLVWESIANVPSYHDWLLGVDQTSAYEYHRLVLQTLSSGGVRGRWTLKSPHHALALDALTAVYPDARLVLLHRDPIVLSASVCSLIGTLSGTFTGADHRRYIAEHWPMVLKESIDRVNAFRDVHPEHPIIDVQYRDLVSDPVATMGALYAALGESLDPVAEAAMADYVARNPKGRFGTHGYDLAALGLDAGELQERFAGYVERYEIAPELPPQLRPLCG